MDEHDLFRKCFGSTEVTSNDILDAFKSIKTDLEALPAKIQPSPAAKRAKKRTPEERGLPRYKELRALANTYLRRQHRHWPELVKTGVLPPITAESIEKLAKAFRKRFIKGRTNVFKYDLKRIPWTEIGASYVRYSCDNSNPRSLDQQLTIQLDRAVIDRIFVPWEYVFADAAVSATTRFRRGYKGAKRAMRRYDSLKVLLIDEIGRASRDTVEALKLGRFVKRLKKQLRGVTDGFDSSSPFGELMLTMYAAVQQWFVDQLRTKVNRGMNDAFDEMTNLGLPAFGYSLADVFDLEGRAVMGKDGIQKKALMKDANMARWVLMAFTLYGTKSWSRDSIAELFNKYHVGGRPWDTTRIRLLLKRWKYVGIMTYRMSYHHTVESGKDRGKRKTIIRPRHEWRARKARHLQIVPRSLWKLVTKRMAKAGEAYAKNQEERKGNRTDLTHRELIRPHCECGAPMGKGHSGKYPSWNCLNGKVGKDGCHRKGYKSVRQFDKCILQFVRDNIFAETTVNALLVDATKFLKEESQKFKRSATEIAGIETEIRSTVRKRDRLLDLIEGGDDSEGRSSSEIAAAQSRIRGHEKRLVQLRKSLTVAKCRTPVAMVPLTADVVSQYVKDLRELLSQDVQLVAPILKELLGDITVKQVNEEGQKKPLWVAHFAFNLVPVMLKISRQKNYPITSALEYLNTGNWIVPQKCSVRIDRPGRFEQMCVEAAAFLKENPKISINSLASALDCTWPTAKSVIVFLKTGERLVWSKPGKRTGQGNTRVTHRTIVDDVIRLKDLENRSFTEICKLLKQQRGISVNQATVRRAWDKFHQEDVKRAAMTGTTPKGRSHYSRLPVNVFSEIRKLAGRFSASDIARRVGCSPNTVRRELQKKHKSK